MTFQEIAGGVSVFGSLVGTAIYIREVICGKVKPHAFTWFVWFLLMGIAAAVGFAGGAVVNAVVLACGALMNFSISVLALKYGEKRITLSDKGTFAAALAIIPVWYATKEPLTAALLVTTIDTLGLWPTLRKAWGSPWEESSKVFGLFSVTSLFCVLSVSPYTLTTGLYPTMSLLMNLIVVSLVLTRRRILPCQEG
ncbi:MAG: hypothetical protein AB7E52_03945 [Bdellovibrionales bacterium]